MSGRWNFETGELSNELAEILLDERNIVMAALSQSPHVRRITEVEVDLHQAEGKISYEYHPAPRPETESLFFEVTVKLVRGAVPPSGRPDRIKVSERPAWDGRPVTGTLYWGPA